jgi:hypothetical protein
MEFILKYFPSENLLYLKFWEKGHLNNILRRIKFKNFGKDFGMLYAMNA